MEGKTSYTIDEAAAVLGETPARIQEMLHTGELEGIRPAATVSGRWKVFLPTSAGEDPGQEDPGQEDPGQEAPAEQDAEAAQEDQEEASADQELAESPPDEPQEHAEFVAPPAASEAAVRTSDETSGESSGETSDETDEDARSVAGESGWTTTKQAAKVLGVSRRSVQGYVRRGLLEAQEEGEGVNKTFLVSIDSLNSLRDRRSREAGEAAKFSEASAEEEQRANLYANTGEVLRHAIERIEARTAEATELRIRLQLTEQAESTLRAELEETRRRREEVERERDQLRRELEALREQRKPPVSPGPSEIPTEPGGGAQAARDETQSAAETLRGPEPRPRTLGGQESPQRPSPGGRRRGRLWRRVFGG